jgi:tetrathionate reductase subunit B
VVGAFGGAGLGALASLVATSVRGLGGGARALVEHGPKRLAGAPAGGRATRQRGMTAPEADPSYQENPAWASWTQPALNAADSWSEPDAWMPVIQNSHDVPILHDQFSRLQPSSKLPHHWVMVIDLRKCIGCQACVVACKSENNVPIGVYRTWVEVIEVGEFAHDPDGDGTVLLDDGTFEPNVKRFSLPRLCNHCDDPPCVEVCPVQATFKRADGLVLIDYTKCIGCGYCINACPYDARFFNPVQQTADKCTFCVHRLDRGLLPACVTSCVARARIFGDLNDPNSEVAQLLAQYPTESLNASLGTSPQVFYIGLDGDLVDAATAYNTIFPYAASTNTNEYDALTGRVLLETPVGPQEGTS